MQSCYQVCKQTCPKAPPAGNTVNGQLCEGYGALASGPEAQKACDLTMVSQHTKPCDCTVTEGLHISVPGYNPLFTAVAV